MGELSMLGGATGPIGSIGLPVAVEQPPPFSPPQSMVQRVPSQRELEIQEQEEMELAMALSMSTMDAGTSMRFDDSDCEDSDDELTPPSTPYDGSLFGAMEPSS